LRSSQLATDIVAMRAFKLRGRVRISLRRSRARRAIAGQ